MKPVVFPLAGSKADWATMQKTAEVLDRFQWLAAWKEELSPLCRTQTSCSDMRRVRSVVSGHHCGVLVAQPFCREWFAAKTTLPVIGVPVKSRALGGGWFFSTLSYRCRVACLLQLWLSVEKQERQTEASATQYALSVRDQAIADAIANFAEEQEKSQRSLPIGSSKTIRLSVVVGWVRWWPFRYHGAQVIAGSCDGLPDLSL